MAYSELPYAERAFVDELTTKADERVTNGTPALVLLATNGREPSWNDCRQSQAHLALPLLSTAFVDGVPMLARLPKELGFDLRWIDAAPEVHTRRQALAGRSRRQTTGFNSATRSQALSSVDAPNSR